MANDLFVGGGVAERRRRMFYITAILIEDFMPCPVVYNDSVS